MGLNGERPILDDRQTDGGGILAPPPCRCVLWEGKLLHCLELCTCLWLTTTVTCFSCASLDGQLVLGSALGSLAGLSSNICGQGMWEISLQVRSLAGYWLG